MNKTLKNIITIISIVIVLVILKFLIFPGESKNLADKSKNNKKQINLVKFIVVKPETLENKIQTSGTILSEMEVQLKPEISGKIIHIYFQDGSLVKKNQLLVKLNDAELQAQLKKLKIQEKLLNDKEVRQKSLYKAGGSSKEDYDVIYSQLMTTKADIDLINAQIDKTEIKAPFEGIIGLRNVDEGQYITSSNTIVSLQKNNPVKIDFSVPEQYANELFVKDKINFKIKGSNKIFIAEIIAKEPKVEINTRTILIRASCNNNEKILIPGAFADIEIDLKKNNNALMIPTEAIIPILKGQKIFLYKSGKAFEQKVETGVRTSQKIQITGGLNEGDTVITSGLMQLKNGIDIKIKN